MRSVLIFFAISFSASAALAQIDVTSRQTVFAGPYVAEVINVIDGDTLDVRVPIWPGLVSEYAVRVRGIDAPELRGAGCIEEREWAERSKADVERFYGTGTEVQLRNVQYDAFSGRVLAEVRRWRSDRWLSLAEEMIRRNMAVAWEPGQADVPWCLLAVGDTGGAIDEAEGKDE